jgi:hypothetical protein
LKQEFPRVYRLRAGWRNTFVILGAIFAVGGLIGAFFARQMSEFPAGQVVMAVIFLGFAVMGVCTVLGMLRTRVVLHTDSIELHGAFTERTLLRQDIGGRRRGPSGNACLIPNTTRAKRMLIPEYLEWDPAWDEYFASIPDVDAEEAQASLQAVLDDADLAGSRDEKVAALEHARRVAKWFLIVTFAVCLWLWIYPHPYDLAFACGALLPWIAIGLAARNGSLYRLNPSRNDAGADLSAAVLLPGCALTLRAVFDSQVLDVAKQIAVVLGVTAACAVLMIWLVRELRGTGSGLITGVLMIGYAYGVVALANIRLDHGEPEIFEAPVQSAHVSSGKSTNYYLKLGPWGPRKTAEDVEVGEDYYARGSRREIVCVYLYRGALRMRWFEVWDCPRG